MNGRRFLKGDGFVSVVCNSVSECVFFFFVFFVVMTGRSLCLQGNTNINI